MSPRPSPDPLSLDSADHWQVLGLAPGADADQLKRAFRQQARRWHPDLNDNDPSAEARFKRVNEAYAVLSDPSRRRVWEAGDDGAGAMAAGSDRDPYVAGFPEFEDYLDHLLGRRRRPEQGEAGQVDQNARFNQDGHFEPDGRFDANAERDSGAAPAGSPRSAPAAGRGSDEVDQGPGQVTAAAPSPPPVRASSDEETLVELTPEQALDGERLELALRDGTVVEVWTPPQAGDGWRLCLQGVAPGGGDHFLQLRVRTSEGLRIDGLRVLYRLEISPADAALGAQVVVPTLDGPVRLRVPAGSSSGRLLRLRGRGQTLAERRGDQLVEIRIVIDAGLGDDELALYRRLGELELERRQQPASG
ncbi:MAG: DnaJ domain-containing protein [Cyanobacteria bacterium]|nr:DnaJ domain-containing protein [Cyanobacteriota bacterium]